MNRPIIQKHDYLRNRSYLDYLRTLPSCVSGAHPPSEPHHIKGYSWLTGSGGSIKGDDLFSIPLTRAEHALIDQIGWVSWERLHGSQLEHWARTVKRAIGDGALKW